MPVSRFRIRDIQKVLRYLVLIQVATLPLGFACEFAFPEPAEITAAVEVMEELEGEPSNLYMFIILTLFIIGLALFVLNIWSCWQLYHLDQRGITKYIWSTGLLLLIGIGLGGRWSTALNDVLYEAGSMSTGATICICILCPQVFKMPQTGDRTETPDAAPESSEH